VKRDVQFEIESPYPPERAWRALTDPAALADRLMTNDFQPRLGHKFTFRTKPAPGFDGIIHCQVIDLEEPTRLAYTWGSGALSSTVVWTLTPSKKGTTLRLEHKGFDGLRGLFLSFLLGSGWKKKLAKRLPVLLARFANEGSQPTERT